MFPVINKTTNTTIKQITKAILVNANIINGWSASGNKTSRHTAYSAANNGRKSTVVNDTANLNW